MKPQKKIRIWKENEYHYPMAFGFLPNVMAYLHDDEEQRPCILIAPGGGYAVVAPTEGEIVAKWFYQKGYQAFVLTYTTNLLMEEPLKKQPMQDMSRAIRYIRKHAEEFKINPGKLVICGFSAGGHLCASVCVHYRDVEDVSHEYRDISNRPDAAILAYPLISFKEEFHLSPRALLGDGTREEVDYMSLENHITPDTPPCFLWQTVSDETVPVENSYLFAEGCLKNGVAYAHHVFSQGQHGLSLANETWASAKFGEPYTMEQIVRLVQAVKDGKIRATEEMMEQLRQQLEFMHNMGNLRMKPNKEVAVWPELAVSWLKNACGI